MKKLVIFKEFRLTPAEFAERLGRYLEQADMTFRTFDAQVDYSWNERRDRVSVKSNLFTAEIMYLARKGILVVVNLPVVAFPFRRQIEKRIDLAMTTIFETKGDV